MRFKNFLITEGGNAVKMSSRLNVENFKATADDIIKRLLPKLKLSKNDVVFLGSGGKKAPGDTHGDIDLAVSIPALLKNNNLSTMKEVYEFLEKTAKSISSEVVNLASIGLISLAWNIVNADGKQEGKYVQLDLMPSDDLEWTTFAYFSPMHYESKYKGAYRNLLLIACAKYSNLKVLKTALDKEHKEVPAQWERHMWDMSKGLMKAVQTIEGKKGLLANPKTLDKALISNNPQEVVSLILGPKFKSSDMISFESVYAAIMSNEFLYKEHRTSIFKDAAKGLQTMGLALPKELEPYA